MTLPPELSNKLTRFTVDLFARRFIRLLAEVWGDLRSPPHSPAQSAQRQKTSGQSCPLARVILLESYASLASRVAPAAVAFAADFPHGHDRVDVRVLQHPRHRDAVMAIDHEVAIAHLD